MLKTYHHYIAGDWVAGGDVIENRNPSDLSDVLGLYARERLRRRRSRR